MAMTMFQYGKLVDVDAAGRDLQKPHLVMIDFRKCCDLLRSSDSFSVLDRACCILGSYRLVLSSKASATPEQKR
jgi:hypothetical protein